MSTYSVRYVRFESGERFPVLQDDSDSLLHLPTARYALTLRGRNCKARTIEKHLRHVGIALEWSEAVLGDSSAIVRRVQSGTGFSAVELRSLTQQMRFSAASGSVSKVVQPPTVRARIQSVVAYVSHLADESLHRADGELFTRIQVAQKNLKRNLEDSMPEGKPGERRGLPKKLRDRLDQILTPDSATLPWASEVAIRNYCIVCIFLDCGLRLGELARLKLADLQLVGATPTLDVRTDRNDPTDPRRDIPEAKTRPRRLHLTTRVATPLWQYISKWRARSSVAKKSPYVFLTLDGHPLSRRSIQSVVERLRTVHPEFGSQLTCHSLRHTYTGELRRALREAGHERERIEEILRYACGWSVTSEMPLHYSRQEIESSAHDAMMRMNRKMGY